jgi:hypothetical protein
MDTFFVLDLDDSFQVILGDPWATRHSASITYGDSPSVTVTKRTHQHVLRPRGATTPRLAPPRDATPLTAVQLERRLSEGYIAFLAVVKPRGAEDPNHPLHRPDPMIGLPADVKAVLNRYPEVFKETPPGLPPDRGINHAIPLEPGS